jgi:alpha-mannosidase
VRVLALKKAEESDEVVVRLVELDGKDAKNVRLHFAAPVASAREVTGQEQPLGAAKVSGGEARHGLRPLSTPHLRAEARAVAREVERAALAARRDALRPATRPGRTARSRGGFDGAGRSLPSEMLPRDILFGGVRFQLALGHGRERARRARADVQPPEGKLQTALRARGFGRRRPARDLPRGRARLRVDVQDWGGFVGQWDARQWRAGERQVPPGASARRPRAYASRSIRNDPYAEMTGIRPGFIKPAPLAWFASHHTTRDGASEAYSYSYLFAYAFDIPVGAKTLTLPDDDKVRVLAVTVSDEGGRVRPAQPPCSTRSNESTP